MDFHPVEELAGGYEDLLTAQALVDHLLQTLEHVSIGTQKEVLRNVKERLIEVVNFVTQYADNFT